MYRGRGTLGVNERIEPHARPRRASEHRPRSLPARSTGRPPYGRLRRSHKSSSLQAAAGRLLLREAGKVSPKATDGVWKAGRLDRKFAVTFVQVVWRRCSGPHPIRRFAPPSPASWGRGPRGDLRCVNTAVRQGGRGFLALAVRPARASRPEMAPQRIEEIRFASGNGMASEASTPNIWYAGRRAVAFRPPAHRATASLISASRESCRIWRPTP